MYIYEQPEWPYFTWKTEKILTLLQNKYCSTAADHYGDVRRRIDNLRKGATTRKE
ncbi:MAG: DUF4172 domain-containing protein [Candidatus Electrothrix sp. AR1]|nr:DUF4172 domain-containing protein [Candidatus Electrothrix sp. AR1]